MRVAICSRCRMSVPLCVCKSVRPEDDVGAATDATMMGIRAVHKAIHAARARSTPGSAGGDFAMRLFEELAAIDHRRLAHACAVFVGLVAELNHVAITMTAMTLSRPPEPDDESEIEAIHGGKR